MQGRGLTSAQLEALFRGNCLRYYGIESGIEAAAPPSPPQTLAPSAPPLHTKARGPHPLYPARALVPDDKVITLTLTLTLTLTPTLNPNPNPNPDPNPHPNPIITLSPFTPLL